MCVTIKISYTAEFCHGNTQCALGFVSSSVVSSTRHPLLQARGQPAAGCPPMARVGTAGSGGSVPVHVCVRVSMHVCGEGSGEMGIRSLEQTEGSNLLLN